MPEVQTNVTNKSKLSLSFSPWSLFIYKEEEKSGMFLDWHNLQIVCEIK
jgi:hypothetical protein